MAGTYIKTHGFKELADSLRAMPPDIERRLLQKALNSSAAETVMTTAKKRVPVRSGLLQNSIAVMRGRAHSRNQKVALVGIVSFKKSEKVKNLGRLFKSLEKKGHNLSAEQKKTITVQAMLDDPYYCNFIEFGTRFMSARAFMGPSFDAEVTNFLDVLSDKVGDAIEDAAKKTGWR